MRKALAFGALPLVFLLVTAFQSSNSVPAQLAAILSEVNGLKSEISDLKAQVGSAARQKFYLTKTFHFGGSALSACAPGYHMASLWEIHDVSNLRYNTELGLTESDSGPGPVQGHGWIRTGGSAGHANFPGRANCNGWTSSSAGELGTGAELALSWTGLAGNISPWQAGESSCNNELRVWCVQD